MEDGTGRNEGDADGETGAATCDRAGDGDATRRALLKAAAGAGVAGAASVAGCLEVTTPADVAAASEIRGNVDYFVGANWLGRNRDDVVVVDARSREAFRRERIYGARHVPLDAITARRDADGGDADGGLAPDIEAFAAAFGDAGVRHDEDVVVYGSSIGSRVARVAFALTAAGHDGGVHVLNGGFPAWNGRVGTGSRTTPDAVTYEAKPDDDQWVTREWIADRTGTFNDDGPGLVDVRVTEAYVAAAGSDALDPTHERHGHLPGAVNVHWVGNVAGRQLLEPGELVTLYESRAGLDRNGTVVVYGDENVDPASTWLTLRAIGFDDVRLYDGGFGEWANVEGDRGRHPVETGTTAVVETDGAVDDGGGGGDFSCTG